MNLNNLTLEEWLETAPKHQFPGNGKHNYARMYKSVSDYLNTNVHTEVNIGARIKDGGLLTDHGPEHIKTVIRRAGELVSVESCDLTPYEVYILLTAIHFHDVGNIFGRKEHEIKSAQVFKKLGPLASTDHTERFCIFNIAQAHGGQKKDKLEYLEEKPKILGFSIRVKLLAAILKLADELADEHTRATKMDWEQVPKESQIYHRFAYTLKSVDINHATKTIGLDFWLDKRDATTKYGKGDSERLLIDEIFERTYKTHLERLYCMRFMIPDIRLDSVVVKINFLEEDEIEEFHEPIGYRLEEKGYPDFDIDSDPLIKFSKLCPEFDYTGEKIKEEVEASIIGKTV